MPVDTQFDEIFLLLHAARAPARGHKNTHARMHMIHAHVSPPLLPLSFGLCAVVLVRTENHADVTKLCKLMQERRVAACVRACVVLLLLNRDRGISGGPHGHEMYTYADPSEEDDDSSDED